MKLVNIKNNTELEMKEITVENFSYSNVKTWIADFTHKEKVQFAVDCSELVIHLYTGTSDAPKKAIDAAKKWIIDPSKENQKACKAAAAAAYASTAADADAAYASTAAAYAADAADAAAYVATAAAGKPVKEKIIGLIQSIIKRKNEPKHKHYEMIVAKAANMDLIVLSQNQKNGSWLVQNDQGTTNFGDCVNYFLCLPQHKEAVLNILNGGKSQFNYGKDWEPCNCNEPVKWGSAWWYMDSKCESRIAPKKEKRWIAVKSDGYVVPIHSGSKESIEAHAADSMHGEFEFIEIEIEV